MSEQPIRVLLLDDERGLREPLTDYLRDTHKLVVDSADTGNMALRLLEESQVSYDVALLDEVLTDPPSGLDVLREIKVKYPDIEVILFTGWGMHAGIEALRAGAYRYFAKPFDKDELAMTIRFAAEQKRLRRERDYMAALVKTSQALTQTTKLDEQLNVVWNFVRDRLATPTCFVALYDPRTDTLCFPLRYDKGEREPVPILTLGTDQSNWGLAGYVSKTGNEQVWFTQAQAEEQWQKAGIKPRVGRKGPSESGICLPLRVGDKILGALSVQGYTPYAFDQAFLNAVRALGNQVAVAIRNARLYEETCQGRDYLRSLYQATTKIIASRDPDQVLQNIVETACRATGAWRAAALLVDEGERSRVLASSGLEEQINAASIRREKGISSHVLKSGEPRFIPDVKAVQDEVHPAMLEQGVKAAACLPLPLTGKNIGVLWIHFRDQHPFSDTEQHALQLYANQSAIAYDNARRMRELDQLRVAAEAMASKESWKDVLHQIAKSAKEVLEADYTLIWPYDAERKIFFPEDLVAEGIPDDLLKKFREEEPHPGSTTDRVLQDGYVPIEDLSSPQAAFVGVPIHKFLEELGVKSFQGIRLDVAGEPLGVLFVDYKHPRGFGEEDHRILEHFANHAALTLKKARLFEQVQRSHAAAMALAQVSTLGDLDQTLKATVKGARAVLRCDIATLYTFDEEKQQFVRSAGEGCRDEKNMPPHTEIGADSALRKIIDLRDKTYHLAEDVHSDQLLKGHFVQVEGVRSALAIQLRFGRHPVGVMFINYRTPHRFTDDEIQDALQFANQAAVAIHNAQLHEKVRKRAEVMAGLYEAGKAITSTLALEETLHHIAKQALHVVGTGTVQERCFTHIALREGDTLRFVAAWPPEMLAPLREQIEIDLNAQGEHKIDIAGRCVRAAKPQKVDEVSKDPDYIQAVEHTQSQLSVPLKVGSDIIGVVSVEHPKLSAFTDEDVQSLEALAAQAAMAIVNAQHFGKTESMLAARTALAWTGMIGSTWRHAIEKHAITIREQIQLLRQDTSHLQKIDSLKERLDRIERLADQILKKPLTPPLSAEEGVVSLPINDLIRERTRQLWTHEPYNLVSLELKLELEDWATVRASPEWLRRALDILIDNAVEATEGMTAREIVIGSQRRDKYAEISITDNGRGIPPEVLERLFREPIKKTRDAKGQGIGLLLALMIVQTYGGGISCRETGPTGTTMVVSLPLES